MDRARRELRREERAGERVAFEGLDRVVAGFGGEVGVAIGPPGDEPEVAGELRSGAAWSTIKVAIALAVIERAGGLDGLDAADRDRIERALTASDNEAAAQLFGTLGDLGAASRRVEALLRKAGDDRTTVSTEGRDGFSTYGQTDWSLAAQHRFISALLAGCLADGEATDFLLELMGRVSSDRWGLGAIGSPARWKGGWGPDPDGVYLVRQMGVIETEAGETVVALAARPADGSFGSGQIQASELAKRLARLAPRLARPAPARCP